MTNERREHPVQPVQLPAALAVLLPGYRWSRNEVGESGDAVYRLRKTGVAPDLFLKHARETTALDVAGEMVRLQWLTDHIKVPAVRAYFGTPDEAWLLMAALPGKTAYQLLEAFPDKRTSIVDMLALLLRQLHSIPVESCPFNSDHLLRLGEARWRLDRGLVDVDGFDEQQRGWTAQQVWTEMTTLLPFAPDPVVTHGDFSLDNILLADGDVAGCIDVGRAGIADRYQDLAILWNCLGEFGAPLQKRFFSAYGIGQPDERKIRFHLLLDELF
jgi:aminoglycoside 3'-phosphotransferase-1